MSSPLSKSTAPVSGSSPERILRVATELFSRAGFDGVSTRQIAAETGLNISTLHHHLGSKRQLYGKVIESLYQHEEELIEGILRGLDDSVIQDRERFQAALIDLVERLLEFARANPSRQRLYVQRWLEPTDELSKREAELTLRLYRRLSRTLKRGQEFGVVRRDLDIGYFLRSFDWMIFSYFTSGAFSWRSLRGDPLRGDNLEKFRRYLLDYLKRMLEE